MAKRRGPTASSIKNAAAKAAAGLKRKRKSPVARVVKTPIPTLTMDVPSPPNIKRFTVDAPMGRTRPRLGVPRG